MSKEATEHRVLLVDDEPQLLAGLRVHLRRHYEVHTASGGAEALEIMNERGPFAVIVSDMRMPGMDGVEFLRKARSVAPNTVRLLLTGYADLESAIGAVNDGQIYRYMTKPCPPPKLLSTLEEAVDAYTESMKNEEFVRGERHRVSRKIVEAGRMAALGNIASGAGRRLQSIAQDHSELLESVIAQAASGGFVSVEDLEELRNVERNLSNAAQHLQGFASAEDEPALIDLRELAREAAELVATTRADDEFELLTDLRAGVPPIIAAPAQIEQVLVNLLSNAIDAVAETDRSGQILIRVDYDPHEDVVTCEVQDNGCGVHVEARPFILRPYFSTKGTRGTGLGLAVASKIVESWKGELSFESRYGAGSRFRFRLPSAAVHDATTSNNRDEVQRRIAG